MWALLARSSAMMTSERVKFHRRFYPLVRLAMLLFSPFFFFSFYFHQTSPGFDGGRREWGGGGAIKNMKGPSSQNIRQWQTSYSDDRIDQIWQVKVDCWAPVDWAVFHRDSWPHLQPRTNIGAWESASVGVQRQRDGSFLFDQMRWVLKYSRWNI